MKKYNPKLRVIKYVYYSICLILVSCFSASIAGTIKMESISSVESKVKSVSSTTSFARSGRLSGGIMQNGTIDSFFLGSPSTAKTINVYDLKLIGLPHMKNGFAVFYEGEYYSIEAERELTCTSARFILSDDDTLYSDTITLTSRQANDLNLFDVNNDGRPPFAHLAFKNRSKVLKFLHELDYAKYTTALNSDAQKIVTDDFKGENGELGIALEGPSVEGGGIGNYLNSDSHVVYFAFLISDKARGNVVDLAGEPLRYFWVVKEERFVVTEAKQFSFGPNGINLPYISFFQTMALLRTFKEKNKNEFSNRHSASNSGINLLV